MAVAIRGLRELNQTFKHAPADVRREYRRELRTVAEPVQRSAERLTVSQIPRAGPTWSKMRVGITQRLVYVAPKPRGTRDATRRRPRFGDLLMTRAMEPALEQNRHRIEDDFDDMLGKLVRKWDHDGP